MPGSRSRWDLPVCCFLLGAALVHVIYLWGGPFPRQASPGSAADSAAPELLSWQAIVARYELQELPAGTATTDQGRSLRIFVPLHRGSTPRPLGEEALLQYHSRMTGLVRLAPPSGDYNCYGWLFLGGNGWMLDEAVEAILQDNGYSTVDPPQSGDLVVYRDAGGQLRHSGLVVGIAEEGQVLVESKWADQGLYVHGALMPGYGVHQFHRSARRGHRVCGWERVAHAVAASSKQTDPRGKDSLRRQRATSSPPATATVTK
jgi:hypothetical protein